MGHDPKHSCLFIVGCFWASYFLAAFLSRFCNLRAASPDFHFFFSPGTVKSAHPRFLLHGDAGACQRSPSPIILYHGHRPAIFALFFFFSFFSTPSNFFPATRPGLSQRDFDYGYNHRTAILSPTPPSGYPPYTPAVELPRHKGTGLAKTCTVSPALAALPLPITPQLRLSAGALPPYKPKA